MLRVNDRLQSHDPCDKSSTQCDASSAEMPTAYTSAQVIGVIWRRGKWDDWRGVARSVKRIVQRKESAFRIESEMVAAHGLRFADRPSGKFENGVGAQAGG